MGRIDRHDLDEGGREQALDLPHRGDEPLALALRQGLENRPGELVAPPGRNRHLEAGVDGACNGREVWFGNLAVAVENCPVEVQSDEANHCRFRGFKG